MPRKARIDIEGYWYHVMMRGQRKAPLFFSDKDKSFFIHLMAKFLEVRDSEIGAYCLMRNHVHILIYRNSDNLHRIFHKILTAYANYFNKKYETVGHVFQGRFKSQIILNERYLFNVVRYIHDNPVNAGICMKPEKYEFSSAGIYLGKQAPFRFKIVSEDKQSTSFDENVLNDISKEYIGEKEKYSQLEKRTNSRTCSGNIEKRNRNSIASICEPLFDEFKVTLEELSSNHRHRDLSKKRKEIYIILYKRGFTVTEIANYFNKHPSRISRICKEIE